MSTIIIVFAPYIMHRVMISAFLAFMKKRGFQVSHPQFENVKLSYEELINLFDSNLFSITHDIILRYTKDK